MDRAYFVWLGVFVAGSVLGTFLKPRVVGIFAGCVVGLLVAGFAVGALAGSETMLWMAGIALMAAPVLGVVLYAGAALGDTIVGAFKRKPTESGTNEG